MTYRIIGYPSSDNDIYTIVTDTDAQAEAVPTTIEDENIVPGSIIYVVSTGATYMLSLAGSWVKQPSV